MSQKKTVFERLEDKMIELQQNVEGKLSTLQAAVDGLKKEIPQAIGQNLMQFADIIGEKIENIEDALKNVSASGASAPDTSGIASIQNDLNGIKASIQTLQSSIKNIKIEMPQAATTPPVASPPTTPAPASPVTPPPAKPLTTSPPVVTSPSKPAPSTKPAPKTPLTGEGPVAEAIQLLETIKDKAASGITGVALAAEMEQIRDTIVKVFRWHPALYELATFARRLKKIPEGTGLDVENLQLLVEKVEEWKTRISS